MLHIITLILQKWPCGVFCSHCSTRGICQHSEDVPVIGIHLSLVLIFHNHTQHFSGQGANWHSWAKLNLMVAVQNRRRTYNFAAVIMLQICAQVCVVGLFAYKHNFFACFLFLSVCVCVNG